MKKINPRTILTRHQVYLERLKQGYANTSDEFIKESSDVITEIIQALKVDKMSDLTRTGLKALLKEVQDQLMPIYDRQTEEMFSDLMDLADHEYEFEKSLIESIGVAAGVEVAVVKPKDVWTKVLQKPIQATGDLLEPFVKNLSARQVGRLNKEIMISVGQGRTISQTVQAIRGTKARNFRDGVMIANARDARSIARTSVQAVSQATREATWVANSDLIDEYQWVSTLDGRTTTQCKSLDQRVFPVGEGPTPPIHVGCRSTTVPYFKPSIWDEGATRSSLNGPVDQSTTYYEWLKDQPVAFQNDALGVTRGKLFRNGGLSADEFSKLQLDRNFQPLTLDEMRKLNPNAFEQANI